MICCPQKLGDYFTNTDLETTLSKAGYLVRMERPEALERDQQVTEQISCVPAAAELHSTEESFHLLCVKRILVVFLFIFELYVSLNY